MKSRTLVILTALAAVLVALAALTSRERRAAEPRELGRPVLPGLQVNDVTAVRIVSPAGTSAVARADELWTVPDRYGYPADFTKVKELLLKLSEMKIGQTVRADERQLRKLRVLPPGSGAAAEETGTLVELKGASGAAAANLLVGAPHSRTPSEPGAYGGYPDGTYVSPDNGRRVYLVADLFDDLPGTPQEWMDAELLNVPANDVARITITGPGRKDVRLSRNAESNQLALDDLAANEQLDSSGLYAVESALSYLRLEDVADPSLDAAATGLAEPIVFSLETAKGEIYTVRLGTNAPGDADSGLRYARIAVAPGEPPATEETPEDKAAEDEEAPATDKGRAERAELEKKVADLNKRLAGWTYLLSSYKAEGLARTREELAKPKEEEKQETQNEEAGDAAQTEAGSESADAEETSAPREDAKAASGEPTTTTE
ncbi:MAG: DUF4340 domain-containing protein [Lentisphaerae bacterium]|nr:DUF4340 domain-containing protein [Lentisphaerota bacterium]